MLLQALATVFENVRMPFIARRLLRAGYTRFRSIFDASPGDVQAQRDVSVSLNMLGEPLPYTRTKPVGYPKLGPFVTIIDQILSTDESAPRK